MSIRYHQPPVTEILPPYVFSLTVCISPQYGFTAQLWKEGHNLKVQFPAPPQHIPATPKDHVSYIHDQVKELQPYVNSLVFGKSNWAYFIRNKDGKRHSLVYRDKPRPRITCPPIMAPLVHESEFRWVRPIDGVLVEGIWRGKQVDAYLALYDESVPFIEKYMRAYELLRGFDVTFECYANLVDSAGNIVGFLTEPALGRPFQASDILALNDVMCKLHERGLHWNVTPCPDLMMSLDNKIRILNCSSARKFRDAEDIEFERLYLQRQLHEMYLDYKDHHLQLSSHRYRYCSGQVLDGIPPLEFPIRILSMEYSLHKFHSFRARARATTNAPLAVARISYRGKGSAFPFVTTTRIEEGEVSASRYASDNEEDKPLLRLSDRRRKSRTCASPYHGSSRKSHKLLIAPE